MTLSMISASSSISSDKYWSSLSTSPNLCFFFLLEESVASGTKTGFVKTKNDKDSSLIYSLASLSLAFSATCKGNAKAFNSFVWLVIIVSGLCKDSRVRE
ncbi:unnamed protein product [Blepharisma stoltei]|uniref:Uncharacterized protein n=1 Tax=Blepharisma stoltei TaxID=1481888 RepID=A0AAU9K497_9CILI|nr:unnamed protein product [Blepharisma stoltei]